MRAGHMWVLQGSLLLVHQRAKLEMNLRFYCSIQATCIKILKAIIAGIELEILFWWQ